MFVDASALSAILLSESDAEQLEGRMRDSRTKLLISPLAIFETILAVAPKQFLTIEQAADKVHAYVELDMTMVPITLEIGRIAVAARARYGKGAGHPARLNMGDCFAYACAKAHGVALLYKGDDFARTDLA